MEHIKQLPTLKGLPFLSVKNLDTEFEAITIVSGLDGADI